MVFTLIFQCLTSIQSTYLSCSKFLLCGLAFKVIHASCPQFTQSNQVSYSRSVQRSLRYSTAKQLGILPREQCISKHMVDRPWPCQNEYPRCFILNIMRSYVSNNNAFNVKPPPPIIPSYQKGKVNYLNYVNKVNVVTLTIRSLISGSIGIAVFHLLIG